MRDVYFMGALLFTAAILVLFCFFGADANTFMPGVLAISLLGVAMGVAGLNLDRRNYNE